jgi:hypothetical protein
MIDAVRKELHFYLVEHPKDFPGTGHPWEYAVYHCSTGANMYSSVHWSYFPNGNHGQRHSSEVERQPDGSKVIFKPEITALRDSAAHGGSDDATGKGAVQNFVENATLAAQVPIDCRFGGPVDAALSAAFDFLQGHCDRHANSWVVNEDGKISLVDNAFTWPENNDALRSEFINRAINENWAIPSQVKEWPKNWPAMEERLTKYQLRNSPAVIAGTKARLDALANAVTFRDIAKIYNSTRKRQASKRVVSVAQVG